jgi:hypothetical protein
MPISARFTRIDYDREIAMVAFGDDSGAERLLGKKLGFQTNQHPGAEQEIELIISLDKKAETRLLGQI